MMRQMASLNPLYDQIVIKQCFEIHSLSPILLGNFSEPIRVPQQHTPLSIETSRSPWLSGFLPHRTNRRASKRPVLSHSGHPPGLPPQLCWPHPRLHRRTDCGGCQGFSNVGIHVYMYMYTQLSLWKQYLTHGLCMCLAALWKRQKIT